MAARVLMPKGSDTMTEGKVLKWLKKQGDSVADGDALVEIETDKVNMEVEAMASGVLRKILVNEGAMVPVGELLAVIGKPDEDVSSLLASSAPSKASPAAPSPRKGPPVAAPATAEAPPPPPPKTPVGGRVLASPLARRMAKDAGVEISRLAGTGPGGRIIRRDVEGAGTAAPPRGVPRREPPLTGPEFRDEPLSTMRKVIAERLAQSLGPVPHFYLTIEVDMRRAKELRESANLLDPNQKLTYNDIILKAVAAALRKHPEVNASFMGASLRYHNRVHIGIAVAVEGGGLITPVIRDCDRKTLQQISAEAKELAARARVRKLKPEEYVGATFSVSNLGMMGIDEFSAVINPPEGAILAVGAVVEKPVAVDGRIEIGSRCRMTLSSDHRVVDGATGAAFLKSLRGILENPVYLAF
ncbi:MAG: hypothetical protein DMG22_18135 [Acidobacteria bacterium]|nr:MAG: hypothetical protein DMG22_18135 [Acidobacteriota bacterium]